MPSPRFQFRLRTLFVVVTAVCVLLAQWPLVEFHSGSIIEVEDGKIVPPPQDGGGLYVPTRVIVVVSVETAALIGWLAWRRLRQSRDARATSLT
jgi:hypothetical protein